MNTLVKILVVSGIGALVILATACKTPETNHGKATSRFVTPETIKTGTIQPGTGQTGQSVSETPQRMADPAAKKCVDDGYVLEPVLENGIPVRHRCVNPETGRACDTWKYFRNECSLAK